MNTSEITLDKKEWHPLPLPKIPKVGLIEEILCVLHETLPALKNLSPFHLPHAAKAYIECQYKLGHDFSLDERATLHDWCSDRQLLRGFGSEEDKDGFFAYEDGSILHNAGGQSEIIPPGRAPSPADKGRKTVKIEPEAPRPGFAGEDANIATLTKRLAAANEEAQLLREHWDTIKKRWADGMEVARRLRAEINNLQRLDVERVENIMDLETKLSAANAKIAYLEPACALACARKIVALMEAEVKGRRPVDIEAAASRLTYALCCGSWRNLPEEAKGFYYKAAAAVLQTGDAQPKVPAVIEAAAKRAYARYWRDYPDSPNLEWDAACDEERTVWHEVAAAVLSEKANAVYLIPRTV
jgi:hypothetical protein